MYQRSYLILSEIEVSPRKSLICAYKVAGRAEVSILATTTAVRGSIKPTMMTDEEEAAVPLHARGWQDADAIANAFVLLALARGNPTGKRFEADKLSEELKRQGWTT